MKGAVVGRENLFGSLLPAVTLAVRGNGGRVTDDSGSVDQRGIDVGIMVPAQVQTSLSPVAVNNQFSLRSNCLRSTTVKC